MLIGGLWHGAAWKFVFWGAMHGIGLAIHKACKPMLKKIPDNFFTAIPFTLITFIYVSALWVFFRAASFEDSVIIIKSIFVDFHISYLSQFWGVHTEWCVMMLVLFVCHFLSSGFILRCKHLFIRSPWIVILLIFLIAVQLVITYMTAEIAPFIYFQF